MLAHVRAAARQLQFPVCVIRHDSIPRSGPIGGIYTALQKCSAEKVLFLACDMPFVSPAFLRNIIKSLRPSGNAVFASKDGHAGFPCLLRQGRCLTLVSRQIDKAEFSLQALARVLGARLVRSSRSTSLELTNINTLSELQDARLRVTAVTHRSGVAAKASKSRRTSEVS
jgi:molybdopterin-guanine dinucleotide biosynthesis protein A